MPSDEFLCAGGESDGKEIVLDERLAVGDEILVPLSEDPGSFEVYALQDDARLRFVRRGRVVMQHRMDC